MGKPVVMRVTSRRAQKGEKILRFNEKFDNFCPEVVERTVVDILSDLHEEYQNTENHFEARQKQRKCLKVAISKIFRRGHVFAYELINGKYLSRIAFRIDGTRLTHIYVIELKRDPVTDYIDYRYVTCYKKLLAQEFSVDERVYYLGRNFYDQR